VIWLLSGLLAAQAPSPAPDATDATALLEIEPVPGTDLTGIAAQHGTQGIGVVRILDDAQRLNT
jgi:hypothetical protein